MMLILKCRNGDNLKQTITNNCLQTILSLMISVNLHLLQKLFNRVVNFGRSPSGYYQIHTFFIVGLLYLQKQFVVGQNLKEELCI